MNRIFFILCTFIFPLFAAAQVLLPTAETAFEPQHNFNRAFIKSKGIKRITVDIIDKKDFQVAEDKSLSEVYEFDPEGRLIRHYYTNISRSIEREITTVGKKGRKHTRTIREYRYDTVSTTSFYAGDRLVLKRYHDGLNYYESRYFRYDSSGNLTREQRYRETNNSPDRTLFMLGNQVLLSEDSFQYVRYGSRQLKSIALNSENRPYKQRITNFDSTGLKTGISDQYTAASWITQEQTFTYAEGRLATARFSGNSGSKVLLMNIYEYDANKELYGEKCYKNDVLIKEVSYVSDTLNKLLNSFVIRDPVNRTMRIIKLRYDFGLIGKTEPGRRL